jgi:hypothetical protein
MKAAALALLLTAPVAAPAQAQAPAPDVEGGPAAQAAAPAQGATPVVDTSKLGVSVSRIQRGLRLSETRVQSSGTPFKLEYQIQVFGTAPRLDVIKDFDISPTAPLSYGAPTHSDFVRQWTPQAYRSPRWPLGALAGWAFQQVTQKAEKSKCEEEIANYRALIMQGISAAAPRCTQ